MELHRAILTKTAVWPLVLGLFLLAWTIPGVVLALGIPPGAAAGSLGLFDYLRFGSPFETGTIYQLSVVTLTPMISSRYMTANL
jgi:hypothetical protein